MRRVLRVVEVNVGPPSAPKWERRDAIESRLGWVCVQHGQPTFCLTWRWYGPGDWRECASLCIGTLDSQTEAQNG